MSTSVSQAFASAYTTTFIGMLFSWMVYGGTIAQILYYFQNYPKDKIRVKIFVLILFALDTVKEITVCHALWYRVVSNRGNVLAAEFWTPSDYTVWVFSALAIVFVQWFYIHNIWILSRNPWLRIPLTAFAVALTLMALAASFAMVYETNLAQTSTEENETLVFAHLLVPSRLQSVTELATNVYISLSLIFILRGSKSGFRTTDNMISKLITFVVNRGLFLFVLQLLEVVLYNAGQLGDTRSSLFYYPSSTININTALIVLNERHRIRDENSESKYSAPLSEFQAAALDAAASKVRRDDAEMQMQSTGAGTTFATHSQIVEVHD